MVITPAWQHMAGLIFLRKAKHIMLQDCIYEGTIPARSKKGEVDDRWVRWGYVNTYLALGASVRSEAYTQI